MVAWFDSHCHVHDLDDAAAAVARAEAAGVEMVCVGTDLASSRRAVTLAQSRRSVWAAVGLHPHDASRLEEEWDGLVELAGAERVVAVGETGFDLHYRHSPEGAQEEAFRHHIRLAKAARLALVIHSRRAWTETFAVLEDEGPPPRTVFHCFTGGPEEVHRALALGCWVSFSGIVSFAGADEVRAAAAVSPLDRVLVETDAPYLAPVPHRGKRNEPAYVVYVGEALAAAMEVTVEELAAATRANASCAFDL